MKIKELIEFLSQHSPEEEVYLLNGVSGGAPLRADDFQWDIYHFAPRRYFPTQEERAKGLSAENHHGPVKPVFCIYGE